MNHSYRERRVDLVFGDHLSGILDIEVDLNEMEVFQLATHAHFARSVFAGFGSTKNISVNMYSPILKLFANQNNTKN